MKAVTNPGPDYTFDAEEQAYLDELDRLRGEGSLERVDRIRDDVDDGVILQATNRIRSGASPLDEEVYALVGHFSKKTGLPFSAHTYVTPQLDGWRPEYPSEALARPRVAAVSTIVQHEGQYVVIIIYGDLDYTP